MTSFAPAAFLIREKGKSSDVIQSGDAFYVLELKEVSPTRPMTLAEASPQIEAYLTQQKTAQALQETGKSAVKSLREALAAGKTFDQAAAGLNLKAEGFTNLLPMNPSLTPEQRAAAAATLTLKDGELSGLEATQDGAICVFLKSRGTVDQKEFDAKRAEIRESLLSNKKDILFAEWLRVCRQGAKITVPARR